MRSNVSSIFKNKKKAFEEEEEKEEEEEEVVEVLVVYAMVSCSMLESLVTGPLVAQLPLGLPGWRSLASLSHTAPQCVSQCSCDESVMRV